MSLLLRLERQQKISKKFISSSNITLSLLGIETANTFIHPVVPSKTIPDSRSKWEKSLPVLRPKGRKTIPFGAAYTYAADMREYPSTRAGKTSVTQTL